MSKLICYGASIVVALSATMVWADEESRDLDGFSRISYSLPYDVEFVVGDETKVVFEGDADAIEDIISEVEGKTLKLRTEKDSWFDWGSRDSDSVIVTVTYVELDKLTMSGSGDGFAKEIANDEFDLKISGSATMEIDELTTDELSIRISGSGDVEVNNLEADSIESRISGSGDITLAGEINAQEISIAGSGDYQARNLRSQEAEAAIQGSGDIGLWVAARLEASIMGSGDIDYYGEPQVEKSVMGSGAVHHKGDRP